MRLVRANKTKSKKGYVWGKDRNKEKIVDWMAEIIDGIIEEEAIRLERCKNIASITDYGVHTMITSLLYPRGKKIKRLYAFEYSRSTFARREIVQDVLKSPNRH